MTAHMVGFTGVDDKGWKASNWRFSGSFSGTRQPQRDQATGAAGSSRTSVRSNRRRTARTFAWRSTQGSVHGLQPALKQAVTDFKAKAGGVVVDRYQDRRDPRARQLADL